MPAPTIVGSPQLGKATGATLTLTSPSAGVGDLLVAIQLGDFYDVANMPDPTSGTWTPVDIADLGVNQTHVKAWQRYVAAPGAQAVTFHKINDEDMLAYLYLWTGVDQVTPIDDHAHNTGTATSSHVAASATASVNIDALLCAWGTGNGSYVSVPGSMTQDSNVDGAPFCELMCAHETLSATGATGTRTAGFDSTKDYAALTILIKGAAAVAVNIADAPVGYGSGGTSPTQVFPGADAAVADLLVAAGRGYASAAGAATSASIADTTVMPVVEDALACLATEIAKVALPPTFVQVRTGISIVAGISADGKVDECCQGLAWVRVVGTAPTEGSTANDFPAPAGSIFRPGSLAITLELGCLRCGPYEGSDENALPSAAQHLAAVRAVQDDDAALRRAICCLASAPLGPDGQGYDLVWGDWAPIDSEANCIGGTRQVTIRTDLCEC